MGEHRDTPDRGEDPRFPCGPWVGFFLQPDLPGKHVMELILEFADGQVRGEGRDRIGAFRIRGRFQVEDGQCWWTKAYVGLHDVSYRGYNQGKGIWGTWEIEVPWKGGFHIWPEAMGDPNRPIRHEEVDLPGSVEEFQDSEADRVAVTVRR